MCVCVCVCARAHTGGVKPHEVLPIADLYDNPNMIYFETEYGSHLNFVEATIQEGVSRAPWTFCDRAAEAFFRCPQPTHKQNHTHLQLS